MTHRATWTALTINNALRTSCARRFRWWSLYAGDRDRPPGRSEVSELATFRRRLQVEPPPTGWDEDALRRRVRDRLTIKPLAGLSPESGRRRGSRGAVGPA